MPQASAPKEDGLLQYCYEAELGCGSFEDQVRRLKWNYEAKFDKKPAESCPVAICGPFGDHGYIEPFLDCSAYQASQPSTGVAAATSTTIGSTERIFNAPKKSVFTRYFKSYGTPGSSNCSAQCCSNSSGSKACNAFLFSHCRCSPAIPPQSVTTVSSAKSEKPCSSWLDSIVDTVLLELEDLLDEINLYDEINDSQDGLDQNPNDLPDGSIDNIREKGDNGNTQPATYEIVLKSLQAKMSDEEGRDMLA